MRQGAVNYMYFCVYSFRASARVTVFIKTKTPLGDHLMGLQAKKKPNPKWYTRCHKWLKNPNQHVSRYPESRCFGADLAETDDCGQKYAKSSAKLPQLCGPRHAKCAICNEWFKDIYDHGRRRHPKTSSKKFVLRPGVCANQSRAGEQPQLHPHSIPRPKPEYTRQPQVQVPRKRDAGYPKPPETK